MNRVNLSEAFKKLEIINEDLFNTKDPDAYEDAQELINKDEDTLTIFDLDMDADDVDEANLEETSHLGDAILECNICKSMIYKKKEDVVLNADKTLANETEECPYCRSMEGFKIVGVVAPFDTFEEEEIEDEVADETAEEEIESENIDESLNAESSSPAIAAAMKDKMDRAMDDIYELSDEADRRDMLSTKKSIDDVIDAYEDNSVEIDETLNEEGNVLSLPEEVTYAQEELDINKDTNSFEVEEVLNDKLSSDYGYTTFGYNYDINPDGYVYVTDIEWDMEESLKESVEKINVETSEENIEIEPNEDGKFELEVKPLEEEGEVEEESKETIAPLTAEDEAAFGAEASEEEPEEVEVEMDDFDEDRFNELGESYFKAVYENVNSFKTSQVKSSNNQLIIEGLLEFNSGKTKQTQFVFESKSATPSGKLRFLGENTQISRGKKSFSLFGSMQGNKFIAESFRYNYKTKDSNGDMQRVYGTAKTNK